MKKIFCYIVLLLSEILIVSAQQISVPFLCGFEEDEELQYWELNPQTDAALDQWTVGTATCSEGHHALYISTDNGETAQMGDHSNVVMAYRTLQFPLGTAGSVAHYNISFDWKNRSNGRGKLYVYIGLKQTLLDGLYSDKKGVSHGLLESVSSTSAAISQSALNMFPNLLKDNNTQVACLYNGSRNWESVSIAGDVNSLESSINVNYKNSQKEFILAFIWVNNGGLVPGEKGGACIDNIQIASSVVRRPFGIEVDTHCEDSSIVLSWHSTLAYHAVEYRMVGESNWRVRSGLVASDDTIQTCKLSRLMEGCYNFRVRGCNDSKVDTSAYAMRNNVIFWCPENHCVNYIDLSAENVVCASGKGASIQEDSIGVIDYGADAIESRHTIHMDTEAYDPRTLNSVNAEGDPVPALLQVRDGSMASVRLGNWDTGYEHESITYTYEVDALNSAIIMMHYAIVLQTPEEGGASGFNLEILDENGLLIDPDCGVANFVYSEELESEWNKVYDGESLKAIWKDWTSIGLNVADYNGRKIQIRLQTNDCIGGAHYGYAYFILDCINASLGTTTCGNSSAIEVFAPEGFDYTWYNSSGDVMGHDRTMSAPPGRDIYTCVATMKENPGCSFELSTELEPRFPVPSYDWKWVPKDCKNYVEFSNTSHVMTKYDGEEKHTSEVCDDVVWEFWVDGQMSTTPEWKPLVSCAPEGDSIFVYQKAYLGGGECDSARVDTIVVPSILSQVGIEEASICEGETYIFNGQGYQETGDYEYASPNFAGCDSVTHLLLTVHPKSPVTEFADTICSENLPYTVSGYAYDASGKYAINLTNQWGCDSIVSFSLNVVQKLEVDVDSLPTLCADGENLIISYDIFEGKFDSLKIHFNQAAQTQKIFYDQTITDNSQTEVVYPFTKDLWPNYYSVTLEFYQHHSCGNQVFTLPFEVYYASSVVEQKWNDVLAVLNARYNGGYNFIGYQWYKDGNAIEGAKGSYLYEPLDTTSVYWVELMRQDSVSMITCPIIPTYHEQVSLFPTLVKPAERIKMHLAENATITLYTLSGLVYSKTQSNNLDIELTMPETTGVYIMNVIYDTDMPPVTQEVIVGY